MVTKLKLYGMVTKIKALWEFGIWWWWGPSTYQQNLTLLWVPLNKCHPDKWQLRQMSTGTSVLLHNCLPRQLSPGHVYIRTAVPWQVSGNLWYRVGFYLAAPLTKIFRYWTKILVENHAFLSHFGLEWENLSYWTEINLFKNRKQKMPTEIFSGFEHINF